MADPTVTPNSPNESASEPAKSHFAKAVDEARAGAQALGKEAQNKAGAYRDKFDQTKTDWSNEARAKSGEAKDRAYQFANEGKAKTSETISSLSKMVEENASKIDETVGSKYGDYARTAARSMQDAATKLDEKTLEDLGEDAREFVRKRPGLAIGMAAVGGFMLARIFKGK